MKYVIAALPLLLVGCAKVSDYQAGCEQRYSKLSDMATCLDISIKNDSRMGSAATPKMYVLAAKLLGQKVDNGEISDARARLELQSLYVNMQRQEQADNMAQSQALQQSASAYQNQQKSAQQTYIDTYNALKPAPRVQTNTTCQALGNTVNCQSY
ncbi:hypothetical protein ABRP77_07965 [Pectobacterium odoriferum]|uniref:hypothetical protein n=1 Tax=Pectobacterium odoriferum TaxID=78398 RepID=UPI0032ECC4C4